MAKQLFVVGCVVLLFAVFVFPVCADAGSATKALEERISKLEKLVGSVQGANEKLAKKVDSLESENAALRKDLKGDIDAQSAKISQIKTAAAVPAARVPVVEGVDGIVIGAGITSVVQGVLNNPNGTQGKKTDATYSADIMLEKAFEDYGKAFLKLDAGAGAGLDGGNVSLINGVNADAGATTDSSGTVDVDVAWWGYEHYLDLFGMASTVSFGTLDPTSNFDLNAYAGDETAQFLNAVHDASQTINLPGNSLGVTLQTQVNDLVMVDLGIYDGDADFDEINESTYTVAQLTLTPDLGGRGGAYRVAAFYSQDDNAVLKDSGMANEDTYGVSISVDQSIADNLGVFTRLGWADGQVYTTEFHWSSGVQVEGDMWDRADDVVGVAFGQTVLSAGYEKQSGAHLDDTESVLELYYNYYVNEHLSVSPDLQVIWNPGGAGNADVDMAGASTAVIGGVRAQLNF